MILISIRHCDQDALTLITNPEDKAFLLAQREVGRIGCMGSVDMALSKMEERSEKRKLTLLNQIDRENKRKDEQRDSTLEVTSSCDSDSSTDDNASDLYSVR